MTISIKATSLSKSYGLTTVVDDITFAATQGDVVGFLGPNGAGKTTTMRMLTGYLLPEAGTVEICGIDINSKPIAAKQKIGYLPEGAPLYPDMNVLDFLKFVGSVRRISNKSLADRLENTIARIQLDSVLHKRIDNLSKGFKRRVGIAQAILHDPEVLIMDEPTDGLDPNQKLEVRSLIREMAREKVIILSTHILEEVDAVCNRTLLIAGGKLLADKSPAELMADHHNSLEKAFLDLTQGQQDRT